MYLADRSTEDAIHRIVQHCRVIRDRISSAVRTVHTKKDGIPPTQLSGGAQLALHMSTAFDRVPRDQLKQALLWAGATPQTIHCILELHDSRSYQITHGPRSGKTNMRRGVKQGCTLAPLLWTVYSVFIAHNIRLETNYEWMLRFLTLYADDTHACWIIESKVDLQFMAKSVRKIYEIYARFGMKVNSQKSVFVPGLTGPVGKKWLKARLHGHGSGARVNFGGPHLFTLDPHAKELYLLWHHSLLRQL